MHTTINSRFKKVLKLQIHLHEAFFSDERFLDSLHKYFLNQTTLDLRKEKMDFLKPRVYCTTFILGDFIKKEHKMVEPFYKNNILQNICA